VRVKVWGVQSTIAGSWDRDAGVVDEAGRSLARLVAEGKLGPKTGEGFRPWPAEKTAKERARYEKALLAAARILRDEEA